MKNGNVNIEDINKLYNYLKVNHLGKENGIKKPMLAKKLGLHEKELKKLIKAINESEEFKHIISTSYKCYLCNTIEEARETINNVEKVAISLLNKASKMKYKIER